MEMVSPPIKSHYYITSLSSTLHYKDLRASAHSKIKCVKEIVMIQTSLSLSIPKLLRLRGFGQCNNCTSRQSIQQSEEHIWVYKNDDQPAQERQILQAWLRRVQAQEDKGMCRQLLRALSKSKMKKLTLIF